MKLEIKVPAMGESISEAIIGQIIKPTGSNVQSGDELLELETDKVNQVLYAQGAGVVTWNVKQEESVKIGQVIGSIETTTAKPQEAPPAPKPSTSGGARVMKEEALVVEKKEEVPVVVKKIGERSETRRRMPKIRRVIAERLVEAQQTTAMLTTFNEIDLTEVMEVRNRNKESFEKEHGVKLGFMSFFVKGVVSALRATPDLNSYIDGDEIVHREYYDIGIAVGTDRGLFVPVVRDCDKLTFAEIEQAIVGYAKKAREGKIAVDDLQGGGFTITNGGVYGSLLSTPIINPPQSGILGMHKIVSRPVAIDNQVVIRPMMYVALSYDHRIVDGKEAVTFLVHLKSYLEDPSKLLLDT